MFGAKTRTCLLPGKHDPQSYTPLTTKQSDKEVRVSVYEDGRSAHHTSEIDYEVDKTPDRKVTSNTPDLMVEGAKENTPSQDENSKENVTQNVTQESSQVAYSSAYTSDERKRANSYLEIVPDETDGRDNGYANEREYEFATSDKTGTSERAKGLFSSDYETVRSSQLHSLIIDINDEDDDIDSDFDDISESNYAHLHEIPW